MDVYYYPKKEKVLVTLNDNKLTGSEKATKMKTYWVNQLSSLAAFYMGNRNAEMQP